MTERHPNHTVATRAQQAYLRWRNANARHPDVLAAQRRERARVRSERPHVGTTTRGTGRLNANTVNICGQSTIPAIECVSPSGLRTDFLAESSPSGPPTSRS